MPVNQTIIIISDFIIAKADTQPGVFACHIERRLPVSQSLDNGIVGCCNVYAPDIRHREQFFR